MAIDVIRPARPAQVAPRLPNVATAARQVAGAVVPLVLAFATVGLTAALILVDPVSTMIAAAVVAMPCFVVWLRRAEY